MDRYGEVVREAEAILHVATVLRTVEIRLGGGGWARGRRIPHHGSVCVIGALEDATRWTPPPVRDAAITALARQLPPVLQPVARLAPRATLMAYNDAPGGRMRVLALLGRARAELGAHDDILNWAPRRGPGRHGGVAEGSLPPRREPWSETGFYV